MGPAPAWAGRRTLLSNMSNNRIHVRIRDLRKVYQTRREEIEAIRSVEMEVHRSEFVSILGPSGCGKSTLLMADRKSVV